MTPAAAGAAAAALTASGSGGGGTAGREGLLQQVLRKSMGAGEEPQRPTAVLAPSNSLDRPRASQESPGLAALRQAQPSPSTFASTMKAALQEASEPRGGAPQPLQQPLFGLPADCQGPTAHQQQQQQQQLQLQQQARQCEATPADQPLLGAGGGGGGGWGTGTSTRSMSDLDDEILARVMSAEQAAAARQQVGGICAVELIGISPMRRAGC